ncbi:hypothetical protein BGX34_005639, partial [Mortierella sp. NVP85]
SSSSRFPPPLEGEVNPVRLVIPPLQPKRQRDEHSTPIPAQPKPKRQRVVLTAQTTLSQLGRVEKDLVSLRNVGKDPLHPMEAISRKDDLVLIAARTRTLMEASLARMETDLLLSDLEFSHQMVRYYSTRFTKGEVMKSGMEMLKLAQTR